MHAMQKHVQTYNCTTHFYFFLLISQQLHLHTVLSFHKYN